ncbi:unnamed protein product [Caenorhabditis sp. 36 PRJEB53466]|nr:unnamed protein product [Caenorhabditis sp. 36 PRJEB53466]
MRRILLCWLAIAAIIMQTVSAKKFMKMFADAGIGIHCPSGNKVYIHPISGDLQLCKQQLGVYNETSCPGGTACERFPILIPGFQDYCCWSENNPESENSSELSEIVMPMSKRKPGVTVEPIDEEENEKTFPIDEEEEEEDLKIERKNLPKKRVSEEEEEEDIEWEFETTTVKPRKTKSRKIPVITTTEPPLLITTTVKSTPSRRPQCNDPEKTVLIDYGNRLRDCYFTQCLRGFKCEFNREIRRFICCGNEIDVPPAGLPTIPEPVPVLKRRPFRPTNRPFGRLNDGEDEEEEYVTGGPRNPIVPISPMGPMGQMGPIGLRKWNRWKGKYDEDDDYEDGDGGNGCGGNGCTFGRGRGGQNLGGGCEMNCRRSGGRGGNNEGCEMGCRRGSNGNGNGNGNGNRGGGGGGGSSQECGNGGCPWNGGNNNGNRPRRPRPDTDFEENENGCEADLSGAGGGNSNGGPVPPIPEPKPLCKGLQFKKSGGNGGDGNGRNGGGNGNNNNNKGPPPRNSGNGAFPPSGSGSNQSRRNGPPPPRSGSGNGNGNSNGNGTEEETVEMEEVETEEATITMEVEVEVAAAAITTIATEVMVTTVTSITVVEEDMGMETRICDSAVESSLRHRRLTIITATATERYLVPFHSSHLIHPAMNLLHVFFSSLISIVVIECQVAPIVHPALLEGPQNEVVPSLIFPTNRVAKNRLRSRVFRDASSQGYKGLIDSPRLFRASGRFHKRVQSATTHDIQSVPLPQDAVQIVSYKYDAEKHNEKKMSDNDIITNEEAEDHARAIERTTMAVKIREEETTSTTAPVTTTTQMPEHNSINEINGSLNSPQTRPKTFSQTVTAYGSAGPSNPIQQLPLQPQPPLVFSPQPPLAPPTFTMPSLIAPGQIQQGIQQQNIPPQQPPPAFPQTPIGLNPIGIPHQPSNALVAGVPNFPQQPVTLTPTGTNPTPSIGGLSPNQVNPGVLPQQPLQPPQSALSPNANEEKHDTHEQLGCGYDWLTNSCKDVFALNWCGKCHDFGNIFLHDCKCVAPLIPLPTTVRPSPPPPPPPAPQRHPLFFWLI